MGGSTTGDNGAVQLRHRPPVALRALVALVGVAVVASNAAIMLSDRAPGLLRRITLGLAERISRRLDTRTPAALARDPRLPDGDMLVHIGVWAAATILVGWALWSWGGVLIGSAGVLMTSYVVEFMQERVTDTRVFDIGDLAANTLGVLLGAAVVAVSYLLWNTIGTLLMRARQRSHR